MTLKSQFILYLLLTCSSIAINSVLNLSPAIADTINSLDRRTHVSKPANIQPSNWEFLALQSLVQRYECEAGYPERRYRSNRALTRAEFVVRLNTCLHQVNELIQAETANLVIQEDLAILQRLRSEFATELSALRGRVNELETQTDRLESHPFSTTTKLSGEAIFATSGAFGSNKAVPSGTLSGSSGKVDSNMIFSDRLRIIFNTSFTGRDLLRISLQASNTPNFGKSTGTNMARLSFDGDTQNKLILNKLYYQFPVGSAGKVTVIASGTLFEESIFN